MVFPPEAMQNLSVNASEDPKAQHEPHEAWSLMGWTQLPHWVLASKLVGRATLLSLMIGSGKSDSVSKIVPSKPLTVSSDM